MGYWGIHSCQQTQQTLGGVLQKAFQEIPAIASSESSGQNSIIPFLDSKVGSDAVHSAKISGVSLL